MAMFGSEFEILKMRQKAIFVFSHKKSIGYIIIFVPNFYYICQFDLQHFKCVNLVLNFWYCVKIVHSFKWWMKNVHQNKKFIFMPPKMPHVYSIYPYEMHDKKKKKK